MSPHRLLRSGSSIDVAARTGQRPLYEDPARFFSLTYATPALREIAAAVADRLRGKSAKGIRQLELSFGGGKTHTMVTLTHLVRDPAALPAVPVWRARRYSGCLATCRRCGPLFRKAAR